MLSVFKVAQADRDCGPTQQAFRAKCKVKNTMEKRLRVFRVHSRILLWRSEVI